MNAGPLPTVQFRGRRGLLDLAWGHPAPDALPGAAWAAAVEETLRRDGAAALAYGHGAGPGPLLEWLGWHLGRTDGRAPAPAELFVTAGASHGLELLAAVCVRPGDTVLVDSPTYHLALRILADHTPHLVGVDLRDAAGVRDTVRSLRAAGRRVRVAYGVPTFANPTGASMSPAQRHALLEVAAREGLLLFEDDTYRDLAFDGPPPPSLWSLDDEGPAAGRVVRIGSFAKTVAPGLRLGYLTGPPALIARLGNRGYVDSGGGVNHFAAMTLATFGRSGAYDAHVAALVGRYTSGRDALAGALTGAAVPAGGWFLWVPVPAGSTGTQLLARAEAAGVTFLPGARFSVGGTPDDHVRLSYSMLTPAALRTAGQIVAGLLRQPAGGPAGQ